jgi:hypothetical protein
MFVFWQLIAMAGAAPPPSSPVAEQITRRTDVTVVLAIHVKVARRKAPRLPPNTAESARGNPQTQTRYASAPSIDGAEGSMV